MTDILCRWLNEELRLSQVVEPKTFAKAFSSGYLFGEILHKYQLQNDFHMFMKKERSISMLNNFTRLEPTMQLLGIPFNPTTAQELMQEKQGVAAHIVYQLYISLERKKKADISATVMKIMQPAAAASLQKKEHDIYCDRLHKVVKRDAEMNLQKISKHYQDKFQQTGRSAVATAVQQKKALPKQEKLKRTADKVQLSHQKHSELMPWSQSSVVRAPKSPPHLSQLHLRRQQQQQRKDKQAQDVQNEIAQFETNRRKLGSTTINHLDGHTAFTDTHGVVSKPVLRSNSMYIQQIRQRLEEDTLAREQREKRVDRFLVEQFKAREAERNAKEEEYLVKRLTRPTKQEQRLVAQLLQIRKQKEVIVNNRLFREQQIQQRREQDFQEALKRDAALAEQERMARAEEIKKELDFCKRLAAERDQNRFQKHSKSCKEIVEQIVDLATKVGEYRLLTGNPIPGKQMKEWKEVLFCGLPLYEPINMGDLELSKDPVELKKQDILNNLDYDEYINMVGEWVWPEEAGETKLPPTNNNILGHVVVRLRNLVHPPIEKPAESPFPHFSLKACVLGKLCTGKTSCLAKIVQVHGIHVLSAQTLVNEALNAYHNKETVTEQQEVSDSEKKTVPTKDNQDLSKKVADIKALYGAAADKAMREGNLLPFELLVDIITEAIKHIPANSGWILDGFPADITQAHLLEKALGGTVDEECEVTNSRMNLAVDPDPPKTPAAPPPALDLALLLDVTDEGAVSRAVSQAYAATDSNLDYLYMAQIPHRLMAFQDTWPKLKEWFEAKQNILVRVDANVDEEGLFNSVESVLQRVRRPLPEVFATPPDDDVALDEETAPKGLSTTPSLDQSSNQEMTLNEANPTESKTSLSTEQDTSVKLLTSTDSSKGSSRRPSLINESTSSYVDKPLPPGIPEALHSHWEIVCEMYVNNIKAVMQELRLERTIISQHLFNIREEFKHYLGRPDLKQEIVSQWQKDFNNVPDDMREDEETKAELHLRLDDLCERLRNISEKRKEENKKERAAVMGDGWLVDHTTLLMNHHSILLQVEVDRFQDTLCILKKYYLSMYSKPLPEPPSHLTAISLLEAPSMHALETQSQASEHEEPQKKLIDDYEEAVTAINSLMPGAAHQREVETKLTKDKAQEKEKPPSADKSSKKPQSAKKKKGASSPPPEPTPVLTEVKSTEDTITEYTAALNHEEEAAKVRISLVKGHGLQMVDFLQSNAEQIFSSMEKWLEEHFDNEIRSIEQLAEVVRHHIESGAKLQNELVLDCTHFCLNGDYHMVASPPPPSRPPSLEKPTQCRLSVIQLESLLLQFRSVAPTGLLSCLEFSNFLKDIFSANTGGNTLPGLWLSMTKTQLMEIASLLKDQYEFVDWRRFLLSCAQPWPLPSLTQLLDVLQHFKSLDIENKGSISEEQYLKTHLWFPKETVQDAPEDPSEPLPYDRLSNLRKFFFQMFADHSCSPPRLNYTSMLRYLAADPNPKQGFIRALSVVLGQHLRQSSSTQLVKSMPSLDEAPEFGSPELDVDYSRSESPSSSTLLGNQKVSIAALLTVISHSSANMKDTYFTSSCVSQTEHTEQLVCVYKDLGYGPEESVPFSVLSQHFFIQHLMESSTQHQLVNIYKVLKDEEDCTS